MSKPLLKPTDELVEARAKIEHEQWLQTAFLLVVAPKDWRRGCRGAERRTVKG